MPIKVSKDLHLILISDQASTFAVSLLKVQLLVTPLLIIDVKQILHKKLFKNHLSFLKNLPILFCTWHEMVLKINRNTTSFYDVIL